MKTKSLYYPLLAFFTFLLSCSIAMAFSDYNQTGGANGYFNAGSTRFNSQYAGQYAIPNVYSSNFANAQKLPLVGDMNNDGTNDIIAIDGINIKIFHNKQLNVFDTVSLSGAAASDLLSNPVLYDIDGNGLPEYIIADSTNWNLYILNSTSIKTQISFPSFTNNVGRHGESMIACKGIDDCLLVYSTIKTHEIGIVSNLQAAGFNSTDFGSVLNVRTTATNQIYCFSNVPDIQTKDYDFDGNTEYIFTSGLMHPSGSDYFIYVDYLQADKAVNFTITNDGTITKNIGGLGVNPSASESCADINFGQYFTSPLVANFNGGSTLETIFGTMATASTTTYRLYSYDSSRAAIDSYPSAQTAEGKMLGNPIKMNGFPYDKTGIPDKQNDFCLFGFSAANKYIDLLCGSMVSNYGLLNYNNIEYFAAISGFNLTGSYGLQTLIAHSVNSETNYIENNNMDEFFNSYGIYGLTADDCTVSGCIITSCYDNTQCKMSSLFLNGVFNSVVIPVDYEKVNSEDYLSMTASALYYVDDKYTNSNPSLCNSTADCSINPCKDSVWLLNTSVGLTLKSFDSDNDLVSYNAIPYYGSSNQFETGWTANVSSGTVLVINFQANQTITNGIIRIESTDNFDAAGHLVYIDAPFTVSASSGYTYGQCTSALTSSQAASTTADALLNQPSIDYKKNVVAEGVGFFNSLFKLGVFGTYLMLIIALDLWIVFDKRNLFKQHDDTSYMLILIGIVDALAIILGAITGIIPIGAIIIIAIIGFLAVGLWVANMVRGRGNNPV